MIKLAQEFGAHTGRQFSFTQSRVRIGRAPGNDVAFDPNVDLDSSGSHCELVLEDGVWFVIDQNSRNGTWVNGVRVNRQRLGHGDMIECGRGGPRLRVELPAPRAAIASNPASALPAYQSGSARTEAIPAMAAPQGFPAGTFAPHPNSVPPPAHTGNAFGAATPPAGTGFAAPSALRPASLPPPASQSAPFPAVTPGPTAGGGFAPPAFAPFGGPPAGSSVPAPPFNAAPPASAPVAASPHAFGAATHGQSPFTGSPPAGAAPFAGTPPPGAAPFTGIAPGVSAGAAVAAKLPNGAQVGKRTVAMLIDQALVQAGVKKSSSTGIKIAIGTTLLLVVAGLGIGGYVLWEQKQETDERLAQVQGGGSVGTDANAGQRIARANEGAIYMLAAAQPGQLPQGFCTGFAVTQDLIATNAHCIDVANEMITQRGRTIVALRNNGRGIQIPVMPIFRDPRFRNAQLGIEGSGYDVGIMRATQPLPILVRLASYQEATQVGPGAQIYVYGFPGLTMNEVSPVATITEGILNRMTDFFDRAADDPSMAQKIQHSAQTTSGSSGSPIFLASGEVIGINAGSLADAEHQSMVDPQTGRRVSVEVNRSSNFKYGMRADLIRAAVQAVGENAP
jgi:S1-C subfamily serine protease